MFYWVADAFANAGASLDAESDKVSSESVVYYEKAVKVYQSVVEECRADAKFAPRPGMVETIQLRFARCLRRLGKYEDAIAALLPVSKNSQCLARRAAESRVY